jgi:hypothetical protein
MFYGLDCTLRYLAQREHDLLRLSVMTRPDDPTPL